jgi:predicted amidophosphoribosyltransferase
MRRALTAPQLVVSVPPKPDAEFDRFEASRSTVAEVLGARDVRGVLEMAFEVPNYKQLFPRERADANRGPFLARPLNGERVLLLDDVLTTGGQTQVCRQALRAAGAGWVGVVALAAAQDRLPEACPVCGGSLRVRTNSRDGHRFIGCSNYPRCTYTRSL